MFYLLGFMFYGFAAIDLIASFAGIDISGSYFGVIILSGIGAAFQSKQAEKFESSKFNINKKKISDLIRDYKKRIIKKEIIPIATILSLIITIRLLSRFFSSDGFVLDFLDNLNIVFLALIARENWKIIKNNYLPEILSIFNIIIYLYAYSL